MVSKYINYYRLIRTTSKDFVGENTFLTSLCLQCLNYNEHLDTMMLCYLTICINIKTGLYGNKPYVNKSRLDIYTSPDQLIAYLCYCYKYGNKEECIKIWKHLKTHWFTYDNTTGSTNFKRFMQPTVIFLAGYCAGIKWFKDPLKFLLGWSIGAPKEVTSGKQKAFVISKTLGIDLNHDFKEALEIYYKEEDHPIREIIKYKEMVL